MGDFISSKLFLGKWDLHMENLDDSENCLKNLKPSFILVKVDEPICYIPHNKN